MLRLDGAASIEEYERFCRGHLPDPYPLFQRLQAEDPVHWSDLLGAWVITRYSGVVAGLRDPRLSSERVPVFMGSLPQPLRGQVHPLGEHLSRWVSQVNPPDHTRLRRLISIAFTPKTVEKVRPRIQEVVDGLIDKVKQDGQMDLIEQFAYPLPATVISEMLGVPSRGQDRFRRWSDDIMAFVGVSVLALPAIAEKCYQSLSELTAYFETIIQECRSNPREDLISALVARWASKPHGLLYRAEHMAEIEWLGEQHNIAELASDAGRRMASHQHDWRAGVARLGTQLAHCLGAGHARHCDVKQRKIDIAMLSCGERLDAITGFTDAETLAQ